MSSSGIGNLQTLLKRLEAATSRLEDIAISQGRGVPASDVLRSSEAPTDSRATSTSTEAVSDMSVGSAAAAAAPTSASAPASVSVPAVEATPPAVAAWDADVVPALDAFVQQSASIAPLLGEQAAAVRAAFDHVRTIVRVACACQKPAGGAGAPAFVPFLQPLQAELQRVLDLRDKNRGEKALFNHLSTVSEGIPAVGWVAVEPTPVPYVNEMKDSAQFYANRVLKEFKERCVVCADVQ